MQTVKRCEKVHVSQCSFHRKSACTPTETKPELMVSAAVVPDPSQGISKYRTTFTLEVSSICQITLYSVVVFIVFKFIVVLNKFIVVLNPLSGKSSNYSNFR